MPFVHKLVDEITISGLRPPRSGGRPSTRRAGNPQQPGIMVKRALLVGCNYPGSQAELKGSAGLPPCSVSFWSNVVSLLLFCQVTVAPSLPLMAAMAPWHSTKLGGAWFVLPVAEARALPVYTRVLHPASPCSRSCTCYMAVETFRRPHLGAWRTAARCCGCESAVAALRGSCRTATRSPGRAQLVSCAAV